MFSAIVKNPYKPNKDISSCVRGSKRKLLALFFSGDRGRFELECLLLQDLNPFMFLSKRL